QRKGEDRLPRVGPGREPTHRSAAPPLHRSRRNHDGPLDPQCRRHRTTRPRPARTGARPVRADEAVALWDAQQAAYIAEREQRFDVMLDVLSQELGDREATILDLACGPGSLARRLVDALPHARVVAVDYDPVLLDLAREYLAPY